MVSSILRSRLAVQVSIQIIQTFVRMREFISNHADIFYKLKKLEQKALETDNKFEEIFTSLENRKTEPEKGIFFDGQVFDAYVFISDLIRGANTSISLIDNYVDDTVLTILSKARINTKVTVYTKSISKQLKLDLDKHNAQYPPILVKILDKSHDRFILIDNIELYHIGASLKDLGKKWFAFSKMDIDINVLISKLIVNDGKN